MKKILFPTDFSAAANNAFIYALELAAKLNASITTLHTYHQPDLASAHLPNTLLEVYDSIELEEFEDYKDAVPLLRAIAEEKGFQDIPVYNVMKTGAPIATIIEYAKKDAVDMIVMGTEGAYGLTEIFTGSVAGEVLENAPCPVLVIPSEARFDGRLDRIAVTTEFRQEEKKVIEKLQELAGTIGAYVTVYCVNVDLAHVEPYTQRMEKWKAEFSEYDNMQFDVLDAMDMEKAMRDFLETKEIDMLVMMTKKRNFFKELFNFSMTKKLAYHLDTPILAYQANNL